jgi:RecB family endonuclease NucS
MPFFQIEGPKLALIRPTNFAVEREIQKLVEDNLLTVFNCRLVAREFSTGQQHAGRIDTLAISEDDNPVIIEYKKVESSELITQSLYYLSWLNDHRGDFQVAAGRQAWAG